MTAQAGIKADRGQATNRRAARSPAFKRKLSGCVLGLITSASNCKAGAGCTENSVAALKPMVSVAGATLIDLKIRCSGEMCEVRAQTGPRDRIASFDIDKRSGFIVCDELKSMKAENEVKVGCATEYRLNYRTILLNRQTPIGSTLVFETVQSVNGKVCAKPDLNDGPSLATFVDFREISQHTVIYAYELDNYRSIQQAIDAKPKYILQGAGKK